MEIIAILLITGVVIYGIINIGGIIWFVNDYSRHSPVNKARDTHNTHSLSNAKQIKWNNTEEPIYVLPETGHDDNPCKSGSIDQMLLDQRIAIESAQRCSEEVIRADQQNLRDLDESRLAATGFEYGGYNSDPNLNPMLEHSIFENSDMNSFDSASSWNDNFANDNEWDSSADAGWNSASDFGVDSFGMF